MKTESNESYCCVCQRFGKWQFELTYWKKWKNLLPTEFSFNSGISIQTQIISFHFLKRNLPNSATHQ